MSNKKARQQAASQMKESITDPNDPFIMFSKRKKQKREQTKKAREKMLKAAEKETSKMQWRKDLDEKTRMIKKYGRSKTTGDVKQWKKAAGIIGTREDLGHHPGRDVMFKKEELRKLHREPRD